MADEKKNDAVEIKIESASRYALLGAVMGNLKDRKLDAKGAKVNIVLKTFEDDVDIFAEVKTLMETWPDTEFHMYRSGNREVWK